MKTKSLLQTIAMLMLFISMHQFAQAQCTGNKVCMNHSTSYFPEYKCVSQGQVNHYLRLGWYLSNFCPGARLSEDETSASQPLDVYPNPVSSSSNIGFTLEQSEHAFVAVYDMTGRLVTVLADETMDEGDHILSWNAADTKNGVYLLRIVTGDRSQTHNISVNH